MIKRIILVPFILMFVFQNIGKCGEVQNTIVLADSTDSYYSLAKEIAKVEGLKIVYSLELSQLQNQDFLIWVASPEILTEKRMVEFSLFQKENNLFIASGIITGTSIDDARNLWLNRDYKPGRRFAIFTGTSESNKLEAGIALIDNNKKSYQELNKTNAQEVLKSSDYIQFSLHGAPRSWFDEKGSFMITSDELPQLPKCFIQSHACDIFRLWVDNSIILKCISNGAVAVTGFVHSPVSGTKIGGFSGLNFQHTWAEFTLAHITQIQNAASFKTYAKYSHYFLLGDPRVCFNFEKPYVVDVDSVTGKKRVIKLVGAKKGFLPVKITNAGKYKFVKVNNNLKISNSDIFFNKDIEYININNDLYLLFENDAESVHIQLSEHIPFFWLIFDSVKGLISSIIVINQFNGFNSILAILFFIIILVSFFRKRFTKELVLKSIKISFLLIGVVGVIYLAGWNFIDTTSKLIQFNIQEFVLLWFLLFVASLLALKAKSRKGLILALAIPFIGSAITILLNLLAPIIASMILKNGDLPSYRKLGYPLVLIAVKSIISIVVFVSIIIWERRKMIKNLKI